MSASNDFESTLKSADQAVQEYVKALQSENLKLVKKVAKAEAQLTTANAMIEELKKGRTPNPLDYMSDQELMEIANGRPEV
jgi:TnpA family transposase